LIALSRHADPHEAVKIGRVAVERHIGIGDRWTASWVIHFSMMALSYILATRIAEGDGNRAELQTAATEIAYLQGGVATLHRWLGVVADRVTLVARGIEQASEVATSVLGAQAYTEAARRGARLRPELDEVQWFMLGRLAIEELPREVAVARAKASRWQELSPAERDVAVLAAAGWANSAIAARRGSSIRTVDAQVATVRRKLMAATRSDIMAHVPGELDERIRLESEQRPARSPTRP
jgi:DNA-binding NarL/FixJ family response regulator